MHNMKTYCRPQECHLAQCLVYVDGAQGSMSGLPSLSNAWTSAVFLSLLNELDRITTACAAIF